MRWPYGYPTRADVLGVLFALVLVCLCAFVYVQYPLFRQPSGFGPDWTCQSMPKGDPVCIKKPGR
ncbi:hypothetical protein M2427_002827 [Bradyrhizobium sp. BR13661]|nr:hypothetical protein [Bradyrhizobium sp. BR13661]